jgi:hypothetical protein
MDLHPFRVAFLDYNQSDFISVHRSTPLGRGAPLAISQGTQAYGQQLHRQVEAKNHNNGRFTVRQSEWSQGLRLASWDL